MNPSVLETSSRFLQAAASYFGIPPDQLVMGGMSGAIDGVFKVQMTIALTPEDLAGIVHRDQQMQQDNATTNDPDPVPTFIADDLNLGQLRDDYSALSPAEKGKFGSFARYKAARQAQDFEVFDLPEMKRGSAVTVTPDERFREGIGGRKVQHVDAPEQEAESELPAAVWVEDRDMEGGQRGLASDRDAVRDCWLMQVALLTPEQRAKYAPEVKS